MTVLRTSSNPFQRVYSTEVSLLHSYRWGGGSRKARFTSLVWTISLPAAPSCCGERGRRRKLQTYSSRQESPDHHRGRASSALRPQLLHEPALFPAPFFFRCFPTLPCPVAACRDKASRLICHSAALQLRAPPRRL